MLTAAQVHQLLDGHQQLRPLSCFQSAVEFVLKLYGVIPPNAYPEQNIVANDGRGYEPFAGKRKHYGATEIEFIEEKYEPIRAAGIDRWRALLNEDICEPMPLRINVRSGSILTMWISKFLAFSPYAG